MAVWPSITGLIESRSWLPLINHPDYEEEMEEWSLTGDDSMALYYYHSLSQTIFFGENFSPLKHSGKVLWLSCHGIVMEYLYFC